MCFMISTAKLVHWIRSELMYEGKLNLFVVLLWASSMKAKLEGAPTVPQSQMGSPCTEPEADLVCISAL